MLPTPSASWAARAAVPARRRADPTGMFEAKAACRDSVAAPREPAGKVGAFQEETNNSSLR